MYLGGIWIKAIALLIVAALTFVCGVYAYKKLNWKKLELTFVVICGIVLLVMGIVNSSYAISPEIEEIDVVFIYQSSNGVIFGREYHFEDSNGNSYSLTMNHISARYILNGNDFEKDVSYTIMYESKSNVIVDVKL